MRLTGSAGLVRQHPPGLGDRFALAVEATVEALAEHPLQFPVAYRGRRRAGVRRFPYARPSDCGDSLLPWQAQSEALANAVRPSG